MRLRVEVKMKINSIWSLIKKKHTTFLLFKFSRILYLQSSQIELNTLFPVTQFTQILGANPKTFLNFILSKRNALILASFLSKHCKGLQDYFSFILTGK